jgi:DNA-binding transcriptional ArsR family regulator
VAAGRPRFTRIPKTYDLIQAGCPTEAIATYAALADYANNKTGLCWPRMETLAKTLGRSARTVQRHLHLLKELGLVEFVERKRDSQGRFGAYLYRVLHIIASKTRTTGHPRPMAPLNRKTRRSNNPPTPKRSVTEDYEWLFGDPDPPEQDRKAEEQRRRNAERRREASERRRSGYEFLFK